MARYTGPRCRLSRREGMDLMLTSRNATTRFEVQAGRTAGGSTERDASVGCRITRCS